MEKIAIKRHIILLLLLNFLSFTYAQNITKETRYAIYQNHGTSYIRSITISKEATYVSISYVPNKGGSQIWETEMYLQDTQSGKVYKMTDSTLPFGKNNKVTVLSNQKYDFVQEYEPLDYNVSTLNYCNKTGNILVRGINLSNEMAQLRGINNDRDNSLAISESNNNSQITNTDLGISDEWQDPYLQPNSPGLSELDKAYDALNVKDYKKTIQLLQKAAEKGSAHAMTLLGNYYLDGEIVQKDIAKGYQYLSDAARLDYAPALCNLGVFFLNKDFTYRPESAVYCLKLSVDKGYDVGIPFLIDCYIDGVGTAKDYDKAIDLLESRANKGNKYAITSLGFLYDKINNYEKAYKWYKKGSELDDFYCFIGLAKYNAKGLGIPVDYKAAQKYVSSAKDLIDSDIEITKEEKEKLSIICLNYRGEIYRMEEDYDKAKIVWQQFKESYPEFVENHKYDTDYVFITSMYANEQNELAQANNNTNTQSKNVIISDIDENIPENTISGKPIFAVIIANENYKDVEEVPYAIHDGETFKQYCENTLGIPKNNIKFVADATLNNIRRELNWLGQVMEVYQGEADIIFYYAGHGVPNESNGSAYLLPVDGIGNDISTGYSLDKLYADLSSKPAKSVAIFLDACFSGAKRDGGMLTSARGVAIKAKANAPKGNMVVLSAAQGDETAYPYEEKGHGMFTYYLLKKLQETKGDVTLGDLSDYVTSEVKKRSVVINGKMQTPLASPSSTATDWRNWKLR